MSFLKARKSKRRWTAETAKVTRSRTMLVSAKMPFTSSVSFRVNPRSCIELRAPVNWRNNLSLP